MVASAADDLKPGDVLNQSNWQKAEGLLPPEILKHYQNGDYANPIVDWPVGKFNWPPDFQAPPARRTPGSSTSTRPARSSKRAPDKQPPYILGFPFPIIDPARPEGRRQDRVELLLPHLVLRQPARRVAAQLGRPEGLERRTDVDVNFEYYDGVPEDERLAQPAELQRPAAGHRRLAGRPQRHRRADLALPRSRQARLELGLRARAAPRARGQPGQPLRRLPRLRHEPGRRPVLRRQAGGLHLDAERRDRSAAHRRPAQPEGQVGASLAADAAAGAPNWPDLKFIGYMDPDWKGVAWAPLSRRARQAPLLDRRGRAEGQVLPLRQHRALHRQGNLPGRVEPQVQLAGRAAQHAAGDGVPAQAFTRPDGKVDYNQGSNMAFQCAENIKRNRATVAGIKSSPKSGFDGRVTFRPTFFAMDSLSHHGK